MKLALFQCPSHCKACGMALPGEIQDSKTTNVQRKTTHSSFDAVMPEINEVASRKCCFEVPECLFAGWIWKKAAGIDRFPGSSTKLSAWGAAARLGGSSAGTRLGVDRMVSHPANRPTRRAEAPIQHRLIPTSTLDHERRTQALQSTSDQPCRLPLFSRNPNPPIHTRTSNCEAIGVSHPKKLALSRVDTIDIVRPDLLTRVVA
jgi:hypothetical protein